jgi:hypothetical protein
MTYDNFLQALRRISAAFGRVIPAGAPLDTIWERAQSIPDEAVEYIVNRIRNEERLPSNPGLHFSRGWEAWMQDNPQRIAKMTCPVGCKAGYRDLWRRDEEGKWRHYVSPCPECSPSAVVAPSVRQLEESGAVVMPVNYPGGPAGFDRDNKFYAIYPEPRAEQEQARRQESSLPPLNTFIAPLLEKQRQYQAPA